MTRVPFVDAVSLVPVGELAVLEATAWRGAVDEALGAGARPVILYGRRADDTAGILVTAVLESAPRQLIVLRTVASPEVGYHSFTAHYASMHGFERELHEQHQVRVAGHPWLKGIRFEHDGPAGRDAYAFYEIKGKEVHEVGVGPIHAGVIEPGHFRFMCLGEHVHHLEIQLGFQHRGVERLLLARDPRALAPLVETIAGDSSVAHTWAYCAAIEALSGANVTPDVGAARGVMLELERIAMHLAGLAGLSADLGFLQGATTYGRLRTTAINTSMRLCGSRFGRGAVRPGGHRVRLGQGADAAHAGEGALTLAELWQNLELLRNDVAIINECFLAARTVAHRLTGVGTVTTAQAVEIGLVGMVARASGVASDLRASGGDLYLEHPIEMCVGSSGDCLARARVRIEEIDRSLTWIRAITESYGQWQPVRARASMEPLSPRHLAIARIEGWRGEVVHVIETDSAGALAHYKVQDPSFRNWLGLALAVRNNEISDFPICNKSFDLSYCGHDL